MEQYLYPSPVRDSRMSDTMMGSSKGSPSSPRSVQDFLGLSRQDHPLALSTSLISQYAPQLASIGELQELRGAVSRLTADLDATRRERDGTVRSLSAEITHLKFLLQRNESEHLVSAPRMAVALAEAREEGYRKGHQASAAEASHSLGEMGAALREFSERATADAMSIHHTRQALEVANQRVAASEAKALEAEERCAAALLLSGAPGGPAETPSIQHLAIVLPGGEEGGGEEGSAGGDSHLPLHVTAPPPSIPNSPSTPVTSPKRSRGETDATPTAFPPTPIRTREEPMVPNTPSTAPTAVKTNVVVTAAAAVPASPSPLTPVVPSSLPASSAVKKDKVEGGVPVMAPPIAAAAVVVAAAAEVAVVEPTAIPSDVVAEAKAEGATALEPPMSATTPPSAPPPAPPVVGDDPSSSPCSSSSQWHPLEALVKLPYPAGVEKTKRESYLSPQEFLSALGMDKAAFSKLPKWKQDGIKKKAGLY